MLEEIGLAIDDDMGELLDGALAFLDRADEELTLAHALEDISPLLVAEHLAGEHVLVGRHKSESGHMAVIHDDLPPAVFVEPDGGVGRDRAVLVAGEAAGGDGLELGEFGQGFAHVVEFDVEHGRAFFKATSHHRLPAVRDQARRRGQPAVAKAQLRQEAFAQVAGPDTRRVEGHQQRVRRRDGLIRLARTQRDCGKVLLDEATLIERGDQ